jgi:hypothetical protein
LKPTAELIVAALHALLMLGVAWLHVAVETASLDAKLVADTCRREQRLAGCLVL